MPRGAGLEHYRELGMEGRFSSPTLMILALGAMSFSLSGDTISDPPVTNIEGITLYDVYHRNIGRRLASNDRKPRIYRTKRSPIATGLSGTIELTDVRLNEVGTANMELCVEGRLAVLDPGELHCTDQRDARMVKRILDRRPHVAIKQMQTDGVEGLQFGNPEPYPEPYEEFDDLVILGSLRP